MTDMIERVARALCRCRVSQSDYVLGWASVEQEVHYCWNEWTEEARAAIEAMREPTEDMLYTGNAQIPDWDRQIEDVRNTWHAMIDAALKERPHD